MGAVKKESLEKLLVLIDDICSKDENFWFKDKLSISLGVNSSHEKTSNFKLSKIEGYLKLDGYKIIDYTDIKNEVVRNQLFRDCIEMSKYRLGKINDTISFDEFCRYAHLQVEELLNYFYYEKFKGKIGEANIFITNNWSFYIPPKSKKIASISVQAKAIGFLNEYGFNNSSLSRTLDFLRDFRNELSHRNSFETKKEDDILSTLALKRINVQSSYIDFQNISKEDIKLYNQGRFIYLKRNQDYVEILENLEILKEAVVLVLQ
ncbi:hypothetical protein EV196_101740 [Mariniflexile fucanivorans]|uniref:Uncharacterized protein n=1 Tax=Mariniflexile fucanivorans TaxID=264023 RepID=A0A4R1RTI7_9FLAO|nr:hypothetical protein [Mariniflexile fucanivorans]TCL69302.1 hypothetical protein EV196_101740 [Mariniflexile fucanivorans]